MTSLDVRTQLTTALQLDLIGPSNGHAFERELLSEGPHRWYLTGFLVPVDADKEDRIDPTSDEEVAAEPPTPGTDDDSSADRAAARKSPLPSSMGLSVLVPPEVDAIEAWAQWGDYADESEPPPEGPDAAASTSTRRRFRRMPRQGRARILLAACADGPANVPLDGSPDERGVSGMMLVATVRPMSKQVTDDAGLPEGTKAVSIFLVNRRPKPHAEGWTSFAFQASLTLSCTPSFVARPDLRGGSGKMIDEWDERVADLQYRDAYEFAVGHGTSARWEVEAGGACSKVWTTWVPTAEVERVSPAEIPNVERGMEALGQLKDGEAAKAALMPLVTQYQAWIEAQQRKAASLQGERAKTAADMMSLAKEAARRIENGILQLQKPEALEAFKVANRAMAVAARRRTWIGSSRKKTPEQLPAPRWRPFQLAFFLMTLRSIVEPDHADRDCVDLLFFPTGGGKTEAYLGLAAFTMVYRRLTHPGPLGCGVSVLMRYTLRLLTLDQLGRATGLMCALELEREANPERLGDWPFEIGLWVGQAATPNRMGHADDKGPGSKKTAYYHTHQFKQDPKKPMPIPIEECPWCGDRFKPHSFWLTPNSAKPLDLHVKCTNGSCPFSGDNHLPLVAVDEPLYRRLPAFIIATVDKFAALPWTGETGSLFGLVDRHDAHGFYGPCSPGRGKPLGGHLPAPDLIIQDELHLISGPLGTIAGVYEAAIDQLCTRTIGGTQVRPKIIASTATVRKAETQIRALFNRQRVTIFPPQGPDRRDSFFAVTEPSSTTPARLYVGLSAQGRSGKVLLLRAALAIMSAAQKAYRAAEGKKIRPNPADPYMTLLGYFNSLRELGGTRRIVEDEVRTKLARYGTTRRRLDPPDQLFENREIDHEPLELTSRVSTADVAAAKRRLGQGFHEADKVDTALATNMISVGLDILRLGLMLVFGQPKTSAEYIQATSRVGRDADRPGLVVTLLNAHKPRDRSHFERFGAFHASFYRAVEATSVTPFAPRAMDRALAATLVALCRHLDADLTPPQGAFAIRQKRSTFDSIVLALAERARDHAWPPTKDQGQGIHDAVRDRCNHLLDAWLNIANDVVQTAGKLQYQRDGDGPPLIRNFLDPEIETFAPGADERKFRANRSMRDVEAAAELRVTELRATGGMP